MARVPPDEPKGYRINQIAGKPIGQTKLYELVKTRRLKSKKVDGILIIDGESYRDLVCVKDEEAAA